VPSVQDDALAARGIPARLAFVLAASIVPAALLALLLIGYDYYDRERDRLVRDSTARRGSSPRTSGTPWGAFSPRGSSHCSRRWALRRSSAAG
jgi:hypothetical protein